jgi:hypothetical protein
MSLEIKLMQQSGSSVWDYISVVSRGLAGERVARTFTSLYENRCTSRLHVICLS